MSPGKRVRMAEVVRRRRTPRLDAVTVLAVVIPLITAGVLALVRQPPVHDHTARPALTRLTGSTIVCPGPAIGSPDGSLSTASGTSGRVSVTGSGGSHEVQVSTGRVSRLTGSGAAVLQGADALAPGLLGLRSGTSPVSTQACSVPLPDQWFTGVGARADHDSVIELVNPDSGSADADITLYGAQQFTVRRLHGMTIPAHKTLRLDLGKIVPRRPLLSAEVQVTRGRLAVHVLDSRTDLVTHKVRREWIPRQVSPASDNRLLGLPTGHGTRTLQVVNPGEEVVRAQVKIITGDTSFAPEGVPTLMVPPGSTTTLPMTKVLAKALADGAVGVEVKADGPVATSLLTDLGTDLAVTVPAPEIRDEAATLLPVASGRRSTPVKATLYVSGEAAGAATVTAYDVSGKQVLRRRVGEQQGRTVAVALPRGAAYVHVVPQGTVIRGTVVLSGDGASVVPLHELLTHGLVPEVSPGQD